MPPYCRNYINGECRWNKRRDILTGSIRGERNAAAVTGAEYLFCFRRRALCNAAIETDISEYEAFRKCWLFTEDLSRDIDFRGCIVALRCFIDHKSEKTRKLKILWFTVSTNCYRFNYFSI